MCCNKNISAIIFAVISIIAGIAVGLIYAASIIEQITAIVWAAFGIGLLAIISLLLVSLLSRNDASKCLCKNGDYLLFGAIGGIIFSIISLAVTINTTLISVLLGITTCFFVFTILSLTKMIACLIDATCYCD